MKAYLYYVIKLMIIHWPNNDTIFDLGNGTLKRDKLGKYNRGIRKFINKINRIFMYFRRLLGVITKKDVLRCIKQMGNEDPSSVLFN